MENLKIMSSYNRIYVFFTFLIFGGFLFSGFSQSIQNEEGFIVFDNKSSEIPYRIPALAQALNGDIIAVADYRYSKADIGMEKNGRLDLRYRIKDKVSGEWGEIKTLVAAKGEGDSIVSYGDPCIVADRESNKVLVTSCSGNVSFPKGTHENHQGWVRFLSEDGGKTWSEPQDITNQVTEILDKRSDGPINAFFIGSGKISQSSKIKNGDFYRLYCVALVRANDGKTKCNYCFYSDDFGENWQLLGEVEDCPIPAGADEAKAEELPDGSVLVTSRIKGGRLMNVFRYDDIEKGEGKWAHAIVSNRDNNGIIASENACNGEILCIPVKDNSTGEETFLLLQSVPLNSEGKRADVGINYKKIGGEQNYLTPETLSVDWDGTYGITPFSSAYSTMIYDQDREVSFFYEENVYNGGYDMVYRQIPIEEITAGRYSPIEGSGTKAE